MYVSKYAVKNVKRHATKWETIFVVHVTDRRPICKQY